MIARPPTFPRGLRLSTWLVALVVGCLLPPLVVATWLATQSVGALAAQQDRESLAKAGNVATAIDQELQARLGALQMLASSPLLDGDARGNGLQRQAQAFQDAFGGHVVIAGPGAQPDGPMRMLLNTRVPEGRPLPPLPRPSGRAAVTTALQTGRPAIGDLFAGPVAGEPLVALAVPAQAASRTGLVVLNTPEARRFQQRLDKVALPPDWALSLLDSRGEPIARRAPGGFAPAPPGVVAGRHRVALSAAPWAIELEIPAKALQAPVRRSAQALAMVIAAATLLAVGAGVVAARRLRRAVMALTDPAADADRPTGVVEIDQVRRQLDLASSRRDAAMAEARAAEARLGATFELANVGIAHVGLDGRWLRVNRRLCEIVGYTQAQLLGATFQDITHPDDLGADLDQVRQLLAGEIPDYEMDKRYRHRDGHEVSVALAVALVRRANGTPDYFISVVEDISARKHLERQTREQYEALARSEGETRHLLVLAEGSRKALLNVLQDQKHATDALRASEARLRNVFEQASDGIFVIDADHRYLDANPSGLEMLGYSRGELLRLGMADVLARHAVDRLTDEPPRMMSGEPHFAEWDHVRRDGTGFPGEVSAKRLDDHSYLAIVRDVSARRAAEQALLRYQVELSDLTQRLLAQERATTQRLAQALHDRLGQTLALARLRLGAMALRLDKAAPAEREAALAQLSGLLEQAVTETRQVLTDLRPPLLEDEGLAAALDNELRSPALAGGAADADALLVLLATPAAQAQRWPVAAEYATFMVAREAIANALRHADASYIEVHLDGGAGWLRLDVDDDGSGMAPELAQGRPGHLGIVGMRERALAVGAHFTLTQRPEGGTRVTLAWGREAR